MYLKNIKWRTIVLYSGVYSCFVPLCVNYMVIVSGLSDVILVSHKVHPYEPLGYTPTALKTPYNHISVQNATLINYYVIG